MLELKIECRYDTGSVLTIRRDVGGARFCFYDVAEHCVLLSETATLLPARQVALLIGHLESKGDAAAPLSLVEARPWALQVDPSAARRPGRNTLFACHNSASGADPCQIAVSQGDLEKIVAYLRFCTTETVAAATDKPRFGL